MNEKMTNNSQSDPGIQHKVKGKRKSNDHTISLHRMSQMHGGN